jgi:hypothetical protein
VPSQGLQAIILPSRRGNNFPVNIWRQPHWFFDVAWNDNATFSISGVWVQILAMAAKQ